jgi:hypothetical protein
MTQLNKAQLRILIVMKKGNKLEENENMYWNIHYNVIYQQKKQAKLSIIRERSIVSATSGL